MSSSSRGSPSATSSSSISRVTANDPYKYDDSREAFDPIPAHPKQTVVLHPVRSFPTRNDTLTRAFFGADAESHKAKVERTQRWLNPLRIDPTFGVGDGDGGDTQEGMLRKAFRRLESSALFVPATKDTASLAELVAGGDDAPSPIALPLPSPTRPPALRHAGVPHGFGHGSRDGFEFSVSFLSSPDVGTVGTGAGAVGKTPTLPALSSSTRSPSSNPPSPSTATTLAAAATAATGARFVLVEERQLRELSLFESVLRDERERLGEQCALVLADVQVRHTHTRPPPHPPLPPKSRLSLPAAAPPVSPTPPLPG